jgi:arylsulfatase A-like enzyme
MKSMVDENARISETLRCSHPRDLMRTFLCSLVLLGSPAVFAAPPNIVLIYADDLGYGDISCNGATAVQTPNIDRIAKEGINFHAGYSTASTCTPSRFALLTGKYAFRQKGTGILPGDAKLIIDPVVPTLPSEMRKAGYRTGVVGKWHLGLGDGEDGPDWNGKISPGANEVGFDSSFIMAATGDRVPCVYVADGKVVNLDPADPIEVSYQHHFEGMPTGVSHREELKMDWSRGHNMAVVNGIGRIGYMRGGKSALWKDEDMADTFSAQAVKFIKESKDKPFFLFFAPHDVHVPRVPHPRFVGKTAMGPRGDAIAQLDWQVGEVLRTLDELGLSENTLVIFSSDNGPVLDDGYKDDAVEKLGSHRPPGPWRSGKYSPFEGGTRMPFLVRWPARIKGGAVSEAMISQVDFPRTFLKLAGEEAPADAFPDSEDRVATLTGESADGRKYVVQEGMKTLGLRSGNWKLVTPEDEGRLLLFDLSADPSESKNVAKQNPEKVKELSAILTSIKEKK